jgi:hypothetical protein
VNGRHGFPKPASDPFALPLNATIHTAIIVGVPKRNSEIGQDFFTRERKWGAEIAGTTLLLRLWDF